MRWHDDYAQRFNADHSIWYIRRSLYRMRVFQVRGAGDGPGQGSTQVDARLFLATPRRESDWWGALG